MGQLGTWSTALLCAVLVLTAPLNGWSFDVHRFITERAIDLLPPEIRPFFLEHQRFIVEHSIDPDLWRNAGWAEEPPRHFVDLDAYGAPPFEQLPRDREQAIQKYGRETIERYGTLPWRAEQVFADLVKAFDQQRTGTPYAKENITFHSAILSHYVSDAHVPFHATLNYDGQLTNQHGIHARFEGDLFARFRPSLRFAPASPRPRIDPRELVFDALVSGFALVDGILAADLRAIGTRDVYDDAYYNGFVAEIRPALEQRMSQAMTAVASLVAGAWEAGGRPDLLGARPAPPRRKRTSPDAPSVP